MTKGTSSYRVAITSTPKWQAVAVTKAVKDRKARLAAQLALVEAADKKAAAAEIGADSIKGRSNSISFVAPVPSTKRPAIDIQLDNNSNNDNKNKNNNVGAKEGVGQGKKGGSISTSNRYNVSVDQIQGELDNLQKSSETIHKEIHSLNSIRNNLLWLLNKVTHYETMRNHSLT